VSEKQCKIKTYGSYYRRWTRSDTWFIKWWYCLWPSV